LANLTKQGIGQPTALVKTRLTWMQYRPGLLDGFPAKGVDGAQEHVLPGLPGCSLSI
jgi:hypothetical protein